MRKKFCYVFSSRIISLAYEYRQDDAIVANAVFADGLGALADALVCCDAF